MNFKPLDSYLDRFYSEKNIPGVGVAVYRHGKLLHTHTSGYADVDAKIRFSTDTLVNLYSATKISTCSAALRMVERGEISLDAPVSDWLPEFAHVRVRTEEGGSAPVKNPMLVRHLFSMTAGLSYDRNTPALRRLFAETDNNPDTRQFVAALAEEPLLFEPGTHFKYSLCHDVLGALLETAAGIPFSQVLRREVFAVVGMPDTAFRLTDEQRKRLAPEYHGFSGKTGTARSVIHIEGQGHDCRMESGGGGLISCVRDYGRLAATLAHRGITPDGKQLLKSETIDTMRANRLEGAALDDFHEMGGWSKAGYGYGLGVRTLIDRERNNALTENGEFGWDGALGCYLLADPATGIGLFYAQQEGGSQWWTWHGTVRNLAAACVIAAEDSEQNG